MNLQELKYSWELFTFWKTAGCPDWYGIDWDEEESQGSRFRRFYDNAERRTLEVFHYERSIGVYEVIMINEDEGIFVRFSRPRITVSASPPTSSAYGPARKQPK